MLIGLKIKHICMSFSPRSIGLVRMPRVLAMFHALLRIQFEFYDVSPICECVYVIYIVFRANVSLFVQMFYKCAWKCLILRIIVAFANTHFPLNFSALNLVKFQIQTFWFLISYSPSSIIIFDNCFCLT